VGKSTLSKMLHEKMSLSVFVDVDEVRRSISDYKKHRKESRFLAFELSLGIAERAMNSGSTVIIDKVMFNYPQAPKDYLQEFMKLATKYDVPTFEFILHANKDVILDQIKNRGLDEKSLLTLERAKQFCDEIKEFIPQRKNATIINTTHSTPKEVFKIVWKTLS